MHPERTGYYWANTQQELDACLELPGAAEVETPDVFAYPLIYAEREGAVIAWLSTSVTDDGLFYIPSILISPAVRHGALVLVRLVEALENILPFLGIDSYAFTIDQDRPAAYHRAATRLCGPPYTLPEDGSLWYSRHVGQEVRHAERT